MSENSESEHPPWASLKDSVSPQILKTVEAMGFKNMLPVQAACIPSMLNFRDVVVEAVTGSGKTLAFIVPLLQIILRGRTSWKKHEILGIIISPARELAMQSHGVITKFLKELPQLSLALFIGGTSVTEDLENFEKEGGNIIVATPGRFHDLLLRQEGNLLRNSIRNLEVLILDEADHVLGFGFERQINQIFQMLPRQRRTGLFSATQTKEVTKLIRAGLRNPVSIVVKTKDQNGMQPGSLENFFYCVAPKDKFRFLVNFIREEKRQKKILIFFATCACVDYFSTLLRRLFKNASVESIHGKMKEKARAAIFEKFRDTDEGILCCTDVLARGIDTTKKIHWVVQFDPPSNPDVFIHRSGRTARNGEEGKALLLLQICETSYVKYLEQAAHVQMTPYLDDTWPEWQVDDSAAFLAKIRKFQLQDHSVFDKAMMAFVSYYKAYSKYECLYVLSVKDLELAEVATCYGLLKFPKMSELKGQKPKDFVEVEIDVNSIPYKDKQKEATRKRKLEVFNETGTWPENKKIKQKFSKEGTSWSISKEKKAKKQAKSAAKKSHHKGNSELTADEIAFMEKALK